MQCDRSRACATRAIEMSLGDLARRSGAFCFCFSSLQRTLASFGSVLWRVPGHVKHVHQVEIPVPVLVPCTLNLIPVPVLVPCTLNLVPVPFHSFCPRRQVRAVSLIRGYRRFFWPSCTSPAVQTMTVVCFAIARPPSFFFFGFWHLPKVLIL